MTARILFIALISSLGFCCAAPAVAGDGICVANTCGGTGGGGTYTWLTKEETKSLPTRGKADVPEDGTKKKRTVPIQYKTEYSCKNYHGQCIPNYGVCTMLAHASGPLVDIYSRKALGDHEYTRWGYVGTTCYASAVPNTKDEPELTLAMIKKAWRKTPFATPEVSIQPVGHRTLVTLPTYFELTWPEDGYRPGEIHTVRLLGHTVRIKPTFEHNTFVFGDGTTSGPTTSSGGPYPTGDITHEYAKAGTYTTRITTTYGGSFSVDGGDWVTIPDTLDIEGPGQRLQVVTAINRLVT